MFYDKTKELDVSLVFLSANTTFSRSYIFRGRFIDDFLGYNRDHVTVFEPLFAGILCLGQRSLSQQAWIQERYYYWEVHTYDTQSDARQLFCSFLSCWCLFYPFPPLFGEMLDTLNWRLKRRILILLLLLLLLNEVWMYFKKRGRKRKERKRKRKVR